MTGSSSWHALKLSGTMILIAACIIGPSVSIALDPCLDLVSYTSKALYFAAWGISAGVAFLQTLRYYLAYHAQVEIDAVKADEDANRVSDGLLIPSSRTSLVPPRKKHGSFDVHTAMQACMYLCLSATFSWPLFFLRASLNVFICLVTWVIFTLWTTLSMITYLDKHMNECGNIHTPGCLGYCKPKDVTDIVQYLYMFLDFSALVGVVLYVVAYMHIWGDFSDLLLDGIPSDQCLLL